MPTRIRKKKYTATGKPMGRPTISDAPLTSKTFSVTEAQLAWLDTKSNGSAYLRWLIDRDMQGHIGEG